MPHAGFPETSWTLVLNASTQDHPGADQALAGLCQAYWYPLYAYVRRRGYSVDEARDLTQEFFAYLLEKRLFAAADREKGRFRSFLLVSLRRFLGDHADRANAAKRGGGVTLVSLETDAAEQRLRIDTGLGDTPERLFEREWALTLVSRVTAALRAALEREGRGRQFERLKRFLPGQEDAGSGNDATAGETGGSEGALKVAVHRLRRRYREMFQAEIRQLVADPAEVDAEVSFVLNALRS